MTAEPAQVAALITQDHRHLDDLLGRVVSAFASGDAARAAQAVSAFDRGLRRHTGLEEEHLFARAAGSKLVARTDEQEADRLARELSVEHVQVRELSGMILRLLEEKGDHESARRLLPNLLRRWDAHTTREEAQLAALIPGDKATVLVEAFAALGELAE